MGDVFVSRITAMGKNLRIGGSLRGSKLPPGAGTMDTAGFGLRVSGQRVKERS